MNWHSEHFSRFHWRSWEGEYFLFNPLTAQTHILNALGWEILRACADRPVDSDAIGRQLGALLGDAGDAVATEVVEEHLQQLAQLGLVESGSHARAG